MNGVYVVSRIADVGEFEPIAAFTDEMEADELAEWITEHESPGYVGQVEFAPLDDSAYVEGLKRDLVGEEEL